MSETPHDIPIRDSTRVVERLDVLERLITSLVAKLQTLESRCAELERRRQQAAPP